MIDYTPTTDEVRKCWAFRDPLATPDNNDAAEFDRWLAEHDRQVKAELIADMIEEAVWCGPDEHCEHGTTCHDLNAWLQAKTPTGR